MVSPSVRPCVSEKSKNAIWLTGLYVNPADRNNGIASQLLGVCIAFCETHLFEKKPVEKIMILTYATSKLYQKHGWKACGKKNLKGQQAMLMERCITL